MRYATIITILFLGIYTKKAAAQIKLHTEDLPRFYQAFDSVLTTTDSARQIAFINEFYVNKASTGLKGFMELRGGNAVDWRKMMLNDKQSLTEKRPLIMSVLNQEAIIAKKINRFKKLYPDFREGDIYFCVGINNSGGTVNDRTVYIGTEVMASDKKNWALSIVLHEFTHTQQWVQRNITRLKSSDSLAKEYFKTHSQLLGNCLSEGIPDFVSELVNEESLAKTYPTGHTAFGLKNEQAVWSDFKKDMFLPYDDSKGWLYSKREINGEKITDLGYFVGYQIAKTYYNNAKNKQQALKEMIELDYTDENAKKFLFASGYLSQKEMDELK